ncbi:hypothetical protein [Clavibacter michiganensis]|uniref:hypothetical protein n=1 Tax=Clavibacter michiganensis TaxID=28447 RepID=UPI003DA1936F
MRDESCVPKRGQDTDQLGGQYRFFMDNLCLVTNVYLPISKAEKLVIEESRFERTLGVILAIIIVGSFSVALTYDAPVLGLAPDTRACEALDVVRASAALYLGFGSAGLRFLAVVLPYVWGSGAKRDFWFGFIGILSAFAGAAAAVITFPLLWDLLIAR